MVRRIVIPDGNLVDFFDRMREAEASGEYGARLPGECFCCGGPLYEDNLVRIIPKSGAAHETWCFGCQRDCALRHGENSPYTKCNAYRAMPSSPRFFAGNINRRLSARWIPNQEGVNNEFNQPLHV